MKRKKKRKKNSCYKWSVSKKLQQKKTKELLLVSTKDGNVERNKNWSWFEEVFVKLF